jgi:hypothetical protein
MSEPEEILERVGDDRRSFLRKMVIGTAFAAPVVSSFSLHGMQAVFAQTPATSATRPPGAPGTTSPATSTTGTTTTTTTTSGTTTGSTTTTLTTTGEQID